MRFPCYQCILPSIIICLQLVGSQFVLQLPHHYYVMLRDYPRSHFSVWGASRAITSSPPQRWLKCFSISRVRFVPHSPFAYILLFSPFGDTCPSLAVPHIFTYDAGMRGSELQHAPLFFMALLLYPLCVAYVSRIDMVLTELPVLSLISISLPCILHIPFTLGLSHS